jgi:hypothetical protein
VYQIRIAVSAVSKAGTIFSAAFRAEHLRKMIYIPFPDRASLLTAQIIRMKMSNRMPVG